MYPSKQTTSEPHAGEGQARVTPQRAKILAKHIMTTDVVWVMPSNTIQEVAQLMSRKHLSAVPVVDNGKMIGLVSEANLIRHEELGTATCLPGEPRRGANVDYGKSHGLYASDVMTCNVITVSEDTPLAEIAETMQTRQIKRVPVMRDAKLAGIVSRADIVQALARRPHHEPMDSDDDIIRFKVIDMLMGMPGTSAWLTEVDVSNGTVELSGTCQDDSTLEPSRVAISRIAHVVKVNDRRAPVQSFGRG